MNDTGQLQRAQGGTSPQTTLRGAKLPSPRFRLAPLSDELHHVRGFHDLQTFFPTLSKIYRLSKHHSQDVWLDSKMRISSLDISGTSGPCRLSLIPNMDCSGGAEASAEKTVVPAFLKVTHLLDPVRWMKGQYSLPRHTGLPWHNKTWTTASNKLQDPWNQAYVETMAAYALGRLREEGITPHFNLFYGAFCARANLYRYNLTDEFQTYRNARWFWGGQKRGLYKLCLVDSRTPDVPVDKEIADELLREPSESDSDYESEEASEASEEEIVVDDADADAQFGNLEMGSLHSDQMSELEFAEESESESESEKSEDESEEEEEDIYKVYAEFNEFPVMLIALEENMGTMDSLLEKHDEVGAEPGTAEWETRWCAWLFQVTAALSVAQDLLGFTHNDLHTNNVVWSRTAEEYMYYTNRSGAVFKVPTFGKLFRIIDFGRAIFKINQSLFISDDFKKGNDAEGQYCFKPLHPRPSPEEEVHPNPSFDLCRLAVSLFEALFPDAPEDKEGGKLLSSEEGLEVQETVSPLYNMIWSWMIDDEGRNILIEPDGEERFPDFELYRHIAAKIHGAVPARQFSEAAFDQFQVSPSEVEAGVKKWSLFA